MARVRLVSAAFSSAVTPIFPLHLMVDAVPAAETLTIRFPFRSENPFTLNSVLDGLGLIDCDVNVHVLPISGPAHRMRPPA